MMKLQCLCLHDSRKDDEVAVAVCAQEHGRYYPTPLHPTSGAQSDPLSWCSKWSGALSDPLSGASKWSLNPTGPCFFLQSRLLPDLWLTKCTASKHETRWSPRTRMLTRMLMVQMSKHMVMQSRTIPFCNSLFEQSCTCFPCYQSAVWSGKCRV